MTFFQSLKSAIRRSPPVGNTANSQQRFSLRENWWLILFFFVVAGIYWHGICEKEKIYLDLQKRLYMVQTEIRLASAEKEELLRQIHSQSDPQWIELVLMKRLGLVPEGQVKVHFEKAPP